MANIFPPSFINPSAIGVPTIVQGTLIINAPSLESESEIGVPAFGHINFNGYENSDDQPSLIGMPRIYETSQVNELHPIVDTMLPEFIQDEYPDFIAFIKAYYRFNEKKDGPLHFLRRLLQVQNIDTTTNELIEYFFREYAPSFPRSTTLSPSTIIKNIRQFYLAKGSEKSFRFLFRVFFGSEIEFYYPRLDILRFSDGKWSQDRTIKCTLITGDPALLIGNRIIGSSSRTSAFVEKVQIVQDGSITSYELFLNRSSIVGSFEANEIVKNEDNSINLRILPMVAKINITVSGFGYQAGQEVLIDGEGFNCKARINSVDNNGKITSIQIYKFGAGYNPNTTTVTIPMYSGVIEQAFATAEFNTVTKYPGYFLNSDGMLSSLKAVQDSYYYQQFSYVIKSDQSRDNYETIVKNTVHPAGFIFFSEVFSESSLDASLEIPFDLDGNIATEVEIWDNLQFDWNQFDHTEEQEYFFADAGADIAQSDVELSMEEENFAEDNEALGPTWMAWEHWKNEYRPTPTFGLPNDEMSDPAYYDEFANTPLKAFADVKLAEIVFQPGKQIDHLPETDITQEED